ncbi:hypothetical protein [Rhizobium jaguaris]|uniref:Uncharacterized protein n=1 Tax=Rhizobium jaguaris TaxID=1312183 RepID=A0A387G389_9HYPH|nr:hypothetical protein [Rhizobium jaguaris]AYG62784.1 hypothetical protein CCGE525_29050 [Rhizobium jaguaris]
MAARKSTFGLTLPFDEQVVSDAGGGFGTAIAAAFAPDDTKDEIAVGRHWLAFDDPRLEPRP